MSGLMMSKVHISLLHVGFKPLSAVVVVVGVRNVFVIVVGGGGSY